MTWVAHLVDIRTGQLGAQLEIADSGSWTKPLGGIEDWSVTVHRDQLREIPPEWRLPWRAGTLMSWQQRDGTLAPWLFGPITDLPKEDRDADTATFSCKGVGELLSKRLLMARDYGADVNSVSAMTDLAESIVRFEGVSYGTMMRDMVELSMRRVGGTLPISFGTPRETGSNLYQMTYYGYNLANNDLWKLLGERSGLLKGPDFAFRPKFREDEENMVEWELVTGTVAQRTIAQTWAMDLDTTASDSPISKVSPSSDASNITNRVWWTGAGEDEGTLIRMAGNDGMLEAGFPLMEMVGSSSDSENPSLLNSKAAAAVLNGSAPLQQLTIEVDGSDRRAEIGRWQVGDYANVVIGDDDWLHVPGTRGQGRRYKIISAKGGWGAQVTLEFQEALL